MNQEYTDVKEEKHNKRYFIYFIIFLVLFFFSVFSFTYSIYKGNPDDIEIDTGEIIFSYSDANKIGNGIDIKDAFPLQDRIGKTLLGTGQYFDFSVTATSKKVNILYKLLAKKMDISTLDNSNLRIYLTSMTGNYEEELLLTNFDQLKEENINGNTYYVLYEKELDKGIINHSDFYRLRMWISENATDFMDKTFSLKVVAHAFQVGD